MPTPKRRAAARPHTRTVDIALTGPFEGWTATVRVDFPLRVLAELDSGDIARVVAALDRLVIEHNFPDEKDQVAASMFDVDPLEAVNNLTAQLTETLGKLPPR